MSDLNITLIQTALHWKNPKANRKMFVDIFKKNIESSDLVVLPEMFSTGFCMEASENAESMDGPTVNWLKEMASEHQVVLSASMIIEEEGHYFNRALWVDAEGDCQSYDKRHLFTMAKEDEHYKAGNERKVFKLKGWRVCPLICYDLRFPLWSRNQDDYDLLIYMANWPSERRHAWRSLLPARAIENLSYVVGLNRVGADGNQVSYSGDSMVLDFTGQSLLDCQNGSTEQSSTLSLSKLQEYRKAFPADKDADAFKFLD